MSEIFAFVVPLALCLLLGSGVAVACRQPFGHALPVALLGAGTLLFTGAVVTGSLAAGGVLVAAAAVAACVLLWQRRAGAAALLATPGLLAFLLLYCYIFVLHAGRGFAWWDEFSHWGVMVRELLRTGALYTADGSLLSVHRDYPPFFQLWEAAWCAVTGGYHEATLYRALHTLLLALFLPVLEVRAGAAKPRKTAYAFAILGAVLAVASCGVVCGDVPFFTSIYLDCAMGLLFAHGVARLLLDAKPTPFAALDLALTGTALLLTKQAALAFYLLLAAFALLCWLRRATWRTCWKPLAGALAVPLVFWRAWALRVSLSGVTGQFHIQVSDFFWLPAMYRGAAGEPWQQTACFNYVSAVWGKNIWAGGGGRMEFSYRHLMVIFALALLAVTALAWRRFGLRRLLALDGLLVAGSAGYALLMAVLYTFSFGPEEGPTLASFVRYMASYWFAVGAVLVVILLGWLATLPPRTGLCLTAAALALVLAEQIWEQPKNAARLVGLRDESAVAAAARETAEAMEAALPAEAADTDGIYVVDRGSESDTAHALRYYLYPHRLNEDGFCPGTARYEGDSWAQPELTTGDLRWRLDGFAWSYLTFADEGYRLDYGELYPDDMPDGALYRVEAGGALTRVNG